MPSESRSLGLILVNERDVPPVEEQPDMKVHSWRLVRLPCGDRHLVTLRNGGIARVTSAVESVDLASGTVTTTSGRLYKLLAPPEAGQPERDVLNAAAAQILGRTDALVVSDATREEMNRRVAT